MGRIVYETATSFDGYIADEHNSLSWLFEVPAGDAGPDAPSGDTSELEPPQAAVQVMGSTTYEWVLHELDGINKPEAWKDAFGSSLVVVFTSRELPAPNGADVQFHSGPVGDALPAITEAAGDETIWVVGGGGIAAQFIEIEALDELVFTVAPVALGQGAPLLSKRLESDQLTLTSAKQVGQFARLTYAVNYPPSR